jgi:hypothetical protein
MSNAHDADAKVAELEAKVERLEDKILTLEEIEKAEDLPERVVPIAEWGGAVKVRGLSRQEIEDATEKARDRKTGQVEDADLNKVILCWGSVKPKVTFGTYPVLMKKNAGAVQRMLAAILDLSGLGADAERRARDAFRG